MRSLLTTLRVLTLAASLPATALAAAGLELLVLAGLGLAAPLALGSLLLLDALVSAWQTFRPRARLPADTLPSTAGVSVVIPSFDGKHLLARLLPSLHRALARHAGEHEVIVVDNGSSDGTSAWLSAEWPDVRVVRLERNRFFGGGTMAGVHAAIHDVVVLLNNDMVVEPGFLAPLLHGFDRPDVLAVTAQVHLADPERRREETGKTRGSFRHGCLTLAHEPPSESDLRLGLVPVLWPGGGSSAIDRRKLLQLGGLDPMFDPFYLEDVDLGFRGWQRGWQVRFAAASIVHHQHRATSERVFSPRFVASTIRRNQHLFVCKNIRSPRALAGFALRLPLHAVQRARGQHEPLPRALGFEIHALGRALCALPAALRGRYSAPHHRQRSASAVWALAGSTHRASAALGQWNPRRDRLRLLVLSARLPRLGTDGSWILFERLRVLAQDHLVTLFSFVDDDAEAQMAEPLRALGIQVHTHVREAMPGPSNLHWLLPERLARDYAAPAMRAAVLRQLGSIDFDVVLVEYAEMAALVHAELHGLPSIYTVHEPLSVVEERRWQQARGLVKIPRLLAFAQAVRHELRVLRAFRAIVTLSAADEAALRGWQPSLPISTIGSGIEPARFAPDAGLAEQPLVAFVGYFRHAPNVDGALWLARVVWPLVKARVPQARLRLIGRDPPAEVLALAAPEGVEAIGYAEDLRAAMAPAAVMAVPIRLGGGLRGKLLEAWAMRKAVVTTSRGAEGFAIEPGRHALVADGAAELADALVRCLRDQDLRRRLGAAGHELMLSQHTAAAAAARYATLAAALAGTTKAHLHRDRRRLVKTGTR